MHAVILVNAQGPWSPGRTWVHLGSFSGSFLTPLPGVQPPRPYISQLRPFHTPSSPPKCPCHTPLCREQLKSQPSQSVWTLGPVHRGPFWCPQVHCLALPSITDCLVPRPATLPPTGGSEWVGAALWLISGSMAPGVTCGVISATMCEMMGGEEGGNEGMKERIASKQLLPPSLCPLVFHHQFPFSS